jgi:predicted YcjX-like family ATPase
LGEEEASFIHSALGRIGKEAFVVTVIIAWLKVNSPARVPFFDYQHIDK